MRRDSASASQSRSHAISTHAPRVRRDFTNVRSNVVTLELEWSGLPEEEGLELLEVLNKTKSLKTNGMDLQNNYLVAQYLDPQTGKAKNGVFFPSDRKVEKNHSGGYETISVTLTEV